jgi:hypothetical protein
LTRGSRRAYGDERWWPLVNKVSARINAMWTKPTNLEHWNATGSEPPTEQRKAWLREGPYLETIMELLLGGTILTWLGTAVAVAMALDAKGRSAFGGFIAAICLPIPAAIYAIAAPPLPAKTAVSPDAELFARATEAANVRAAKATPA